MCTLYFSDFMFFRRPVPSSSCRKRKAPGKHSYGDSGDDFETPEHSDTEAQQQSVSVVFAHYSIDLYLL